MIITDKRLAYAKLFNDMASSWFLSKRLMNGLSYTSLLLYGDFRVCFYLLIIMSIVI